MKTESSEPVSRRKNDANSILLRLERNNRNLSYLKEKLSSYVCEPKTLNLFEQKEYLREKLEGLRNSNQELMSALKQRQVSFEDRMEHVREQRRALRELENKVLEYIGMAKMHC